MKYRKHRNTTDLGVRLHPDGGALDIVNQTTGDGWHGLQFFLRSGDHEYRPVRLDHPIGRSGKVTWQIEIASGVTVHFQADPTPTGSGIWLKPRIINHSPQDFPFDAYGFVPAEGTRGPWLGQRGIPVSAHSENLRYEHLPYSHPSFPLIRPLPEVGRWYGRQGSGPIPVLALGRLGQQRWLVEGSASQDRAVLSWHLALPTQPQQMLSYRSEHFWYGAAADAVPAGATLALESSLFLVITAEPDSLYETYMGVLAAIYGQRFAGVRSRLATEPVYCSCNYGINTNITEAVCVERIKLVSQLQGGGIFQLDHGYQKPHGEHQSWGYLDAFYPDAEKAWDMKRFPGGPSRIVEECHRHGLTPAIWWTPRMDVGGPIATEHPDWIAVNAQGKPIALVGDLHPDYSVPAVRNFVEYNIHTAIRAWKYEGIKLDFFSWAFDAPDLVYRHGGTSVQWRRWLLGLIRRMLGPRGYFLHCISCPLGNPFLALDGCDSFRAGMDIADGDWATHLANCSWILGALAASGRRTWLADLDSFMGSPAVPAAERRFRCALGYLTGGMLDFSGPVERLDIQARKDYRRLCERCDQGGRLLVPDVQAFAGRPLPCKLLRRHGGQSRTRRRFKIDATVGLFNWQDNPQVVGISLVECDLAKASHAQDFWTGRAVPIHKGLLTAQLAPRGHALIDIMA